MLEAVLSQQGSATCHVFTCFSYMLSSLWQDFSSQKEANRRSSWLKQPQWKVFCQACCHSAEEFCRGLWGSAAHTGEPCHLSLCLTHSSEKALFRACEDVRRSATGPGHEMSHDVQGTLCCTRRST